MAYSRRQVEDHKTIMNKDLYDNLQDGIDEAKQSITNTNNSIFDLRTETQKVLKIVTPNVFSASVVSVN